MDSAVVFSKERSKAESSGWHPLVMLLSLNNDSLDHGGVTALVSPHSGHWGRHVNDLIGYLKCLFLL